MYDPLKKKLYYINNKEKILEKTKERYIKNRNKLLDYQIKYRKNNYDKISNRSKRWRETNKEIIKERKKSYHIENAERIKEKSKIWYQNNRIKADQTRKKYYEKNKSIIIKRNLKREMTKYHSDLEFKLKHILRKRLYVAIKFGTKNGSAVKLLGCSIEEFKIYIESKFTKGMTWDNWSVNGWHLDHIIPLDYFDLFNEKQLAQACHYTNLQPLWAIDNLKKSNKLPTDINVNYLKSIV